MKCRIAFALLALSLFAAPAPAAAPEELDDLGTQLEALSEAIVSQIKLVRIYEEMGKTEEAENTLAQIRSMVSDQRALLDRIAELAGGEPAAAATAKPSPGPTPPKLTERPRSVGAAADGGLDWLAAAQHPDGYWDGDAFGRRIGVEDTKSIGAGGPLYDPGLTGLALMAFFAAGETHRSGDHPDTVMAGLKWLRQIQDPEGCFGPRTSNHFTYNHAIATIAMCEAYGLTKSPLFKNSAQNALDFVAKCQNPYLAWRYGVRPGDNDTSVTGWMVQALVSGKQAGLRVGNEGFDGAQAWLDKVTEPEFGRVGYTFRGSAPARSQDLMDRFPADKSESLTAEGIVMRFHFGESDSPEKGPEIMKGTDLVLRRLPAWDESDGSIDMYYWFWGTLAMQRVGGEPWAAWKPAMKKTLLGSQCSEGALAGSWDPAGAWGRDGGRIYSTAMMTLIASAIRNSER